MEVVLCIALKTLIRVIEPMVPHLAEECWALTKTNRSIIYEPWPVINHSFLEKNEVTVVVQINGKRRAEISVEKIKLKSKYLKKSKTSKI